MRRLVLPALFAILLPGCPLTDEYYVQPDSGDSTQLSEARCGDGVAQGHEACDGVDLLEQTCETLGLPQGALACTPACTFDVARCAPPPVVCGDGLAQAAEGCDGSDLRGQTCATLGLTTGTLACTPACTFELSGCMARVPACGDDLAENTEACDGSDLRGESCETLGFGPGTLACDERCGFATSGCGAIPGCGGSTGVPCCEPKAEVCDGVSNDCDEEVDEGTGVCPDEGSGRTHDGHIYLLYLHASRDGQGWGPGQDGRNYGGTQEDYGEATNTCRAAGAVLGLGVEFDLARIETAEENAFARAWIAETATEAGMVWIGANDLAAEGRWVWGQDADAVQFFSSGQRGGGSAVMNLFNDFSEGQPNSANYVDEDCGAFDSDFDWHWNDLNCAEPRLGLLCEQLDD
jgi:hypothetical protein